MKWNDAYEVQFVLVIGLAAIVLCSVFVFKYVITRITDKRIERTFKKRYRS